MVVLWLLLSFGGLSAFAQDLPPGLLEPCKQRNEKHDALAQALKSDAEIPQECKAGLENSGKVCKKDPSDEGLPEAGSGGTNQPAKVTAEAAGMARDKYNEHKKQCDEAIRPADQACAGATEKLNAEWRAETDPAKKEKLLKQIQATRAARVAARSFADTSKKCSEGYATIYDNTAQQANSIAGLTGERPPNSLTGDTLTDKAATTLAKDAAKEFLKQAVAKEAAKLVPGGSAALELAEGNPGQAAKEVAKEFIPGRVIKKAVDIAITPTPVSVCSQQFYGPIAAYQAGCGYNSQSVNNAIAILEK